MRIKVPATRNGLSVIRSLSRQGLSVMTTTVPASTWMIFAVAAGAAQIAPYSGMLQKRNILSKMEGVIAMQEIIDEQGYAVEICTGIYDATEVVVYAANGIQSAFIWEKDVESCLTQGLVDEAAANFEGNWKQIDAY